jgi:hypothetical protein
MSLDITICHRRVPGSRGQPAVISHLQEAAGCVTVIGDEATRVPARGLLWIQGNAAWFPDVCRRLCRMPREHRPMVVIWHVEPLPPPRAAGLPLPRLTLHEVAKIVVRSARATDVYTNWLTLRQLGRSAVPDILIVSAPGRREYLAERGLHSHWVPFGYHAGMGRDLGRRRDIDVLFLGEPGVPRRRRALGFLRSEGIACTAVGDWHNPAYWGESRTELLNRVRILLNFSRTPGEYSGMRILLGLANKALVVSEPIYDPAPYVPGRHFVMAPLEQMPSLIREYLADENARAAIVDEGHRMALSEWTLRRSVQRILDIVASRRTQEGDTVAQSAADSGRAAIRA